MVYHKRATIEVKREGEAQTPPVPEEDHMQYQNMSDQQLGQHVSEAGRAIIEAVEFGHSVDEASKVYAAALHAYRMRSN